MAKQLIRRLSTTSVRSTIASGSVVYESQRSVDEYLQMHFRLGGVPSRPCRFDLNNLGWRGIWGVRHCRPTKNQCPLEGLRIGSVPLENGTRESFEVRVRPMHFLSDDRRETFVRRTMHTNDDRSYPE